MVKSGDNIEMALPVSNPYEEIYREKDKWWRLMTPEWINPSETPVAPENSQEIWKNYLKRLGLVEDFHDKLSDYYHPITHAHYGADEKQKAWTNFTWEHGGSSRSLSSLPIGALSAAPASTNAVGKIYVEIGGIELSFKKSEPDKPGDGTVPEVSGAASASKAKFAAKMTGYDHQGSYQNQSVQDVTTYSVARIAKDAS
jgi:hypothetical protein